MLMAAALSALLWNLLFIPPVMTFKIERLEDALMCLFFFLVALSTGRLTSRLRVREQEEREREKRRMPCSCIRAPLGPPRTCLP